jgi:hypothetical protein
LVVRLLHEDIIQDRFWLKYPVIPVASTLQLADQVAVQMETLSIEQGADAASS